MCKDVPFSFKPAVYLWHPPSITTHINNVSGRATGVCGIRDRRICTQFLCGNVPLHNKNHLKKVPLVCVSLPSMPGMAAPLS